MAFRDLLSSFVREMPRGAYSQCWFSELHSIRVYRRDGTLHDKGGGTFRYRWALYKVPEGRNKAQGVTLKELISKAVSLRLENKL